MNAQVGRVFMSIALLTTAFLLPGCDGGSNGSGSDLPPVTSARALGNHYVEVGFAGPAGLEAEDVSHYGILDPGGAALPVMNAALSPDGQRIVLSTLDQQAVTYSLSVGSTGGTSGASVQFFGSTTGEPYLQSAIALSSTEILLTFSTQMDAVTAENAAYYEIADPDGDTDIDIRITGADLGSDRTTVVLTTTPQDNVPYAVRATNLRRRFTCEDGGRLFLDDGAQGAVCSGHFRPMTPEDHLTDFVLTGRTAIDKNAVLNPNAAGTGGSVATSLNGIGVRRPLCDGGGQAIEGGSGSDADEELIIVSDIAVLADDIVLGMRDLAFPADQPVLYLSSAGAAGYDHVFDSAAVQAAFTMGAGAGELSIANLPGLTDGLQIDALKIRETNGSIHVHSVCGLSTGGRLIDPTRNVATFRGIPALDTAGPEVLGAESISDTQVLVSFNEPLDSESADALNFVISPELTVTGAELRRYDTQVLLTTLPQRAGVDYVLTVADVRDKAGNAIDATASPAVNTAEFSFAGGPGSLGADTLPRVIGAASTSNTTVLVTFSKPMGASALITSNYFIVQQNVTPEAGVLVIVNDPVATADDPVFLGDDRTSVQLTTLSQNEVVYVLTVVNVRDESGNQLAPRSPLVDPTTAVFPGTPPTAGQFADTDADGIPDHAEQRGYVVSIELITGETADRDVTSDPLNADTDEDGLSDLEERSLVSDPRSADSDGDEIGDYDEFNVYFSNLIDQDTDDDTSDDGVEISFFRTSALFDDTDGDGLLDGDEIVTDNRNPLIADLPRPRIDIGQVVLRLDTRFSFTNTDGVSTTSEESVETLLAQSVTDTFGFSDTNTTTNAIETGASLGFEAGIGAGGATVTGSLSFGYSYTDEESMTFSTESSREAQEAYQQSLTTAQTVDQQQAVTREVAGASVELDLTVRNEGDIAFSISNLEISVLQQDPADRSTFTPVASLLPAQSGLVFNLGPFVLERGPVIFRSNEVFPSLVEDLLKSPRGLVFRVANYDVQDEFGRQFAFASQQINDRTAGLVIDYGNGQTETYRVATASTFDADGQPAGVTMDYVLQSILGFEADPDPMTPDAVLDGGDGLAGTMASGDDVQVIAVGQPVGPDGVVVLPGFNGIINTTSAGDDQAGLTRGYTVAADANGVTRLTRVKSIRNRTATAGAQQVTVRFWAVLTSAEVDPFTDFGDIVLKGGENYSLAFVADRDLDGLIDREEFLFGSSDLNPNTDGPAVLDGGNGVVDTAAAAADVQLSPQNAVVPPFAAIIGPGSDNSMTTTINNLSGCGSTRDCDDVLAVGKDTLSDFTEVRVGWIVRIDSEFPYRSFSNPTQPDTDADELFDHGEQCVGTDAEKRDTDGDGIKDYDEVFEVIFAGANGIADTQIAAGSDDIQVVPFGQLAPPDGVVIRPGPDGELDSTANTVGGGDDVSHAGPADSCLTGILGLTAPSPGALNPLNPDTDKGGVNDGLEIALGGDPTSAADDPSLRDTDLDGLTDQEEFAGWTVHKTALGAGHACSDNGMTACQADADCMGECLAGQVVSSIAVGSSPFEPDSDFDGLPDLLERTLGSHPLLPDTDGDALADFDELNPSSGASVDPAAFFEFQQACAAAFRCEYSSAGSQLHGTSLVDEDTDRDGRNDTEELFGDWIVSICSSTGSAAPVVVQSSPIERDEDADGVPDGIEQQNLTNPQNADTDGDGTLDGADGDSTGCSKVVTIVFNNYKTGGNNCCDGCTGNYEFDLFVNSTHVINQNVDNALDDNDTHVFDANSTMVTLSPGQSFTISGNIVETQNVDDQWSIGSRTYSFSSVSSGVVNILYDTTLDGADTCYTEAGGHKIQVTMTVVQ